MSAHTPVRHTASRDYANGPHRAPEWMHRLSLSTVLLVFLCMSVPAWADEPGLGTLILEYDNDVFGGEDRYYTNGGRLTWFSMDSRVPDWVGWAPDLVPLFPEQDDLTISYTLGQNIYTPDDISKKDPSRDDRPYAGWLYFTMGLGAETNNQLDRLLLSLGVVGPASLADETQQFVHKNVESITPSGWDTQLSNEPALMLSYERQWRALFSYGSNGWRWDGTPFLGGAIGNVITQANAGLMLRFGRNLPRDWGPPRITPTLPGSGVFSPRTDFGWYLFTGVDGRAVIYNLFLDGNTITDSRSVDKHHFVGQIQMGGAIQIDRRTRITYTHVVSSREFRTQRGSTTRFGSVSLSIRF